MRVQKSSPFPWLLRLLKWLCPEDLYEGIEGDLIEQYQINLKRRSAIRSNWLLFYNGLKFIRPAIQRRKKSYMYKKSTGMIFNYLKTTFRNIRKQSVYYTLNFLGLTLGLACCALAIIYVQYESSYDDFHHDSANTYRVTGKIAQRAWFPSIQNVYADPLMEGVLPEIKKITKFRRAPQQFAVYGEKRLGTRGMVTNPGSDFFDIFNFEPIEGQPEQMLEEPNSVVFTATSAEKLLGTPPHLGKIIKWDSLTLEVTGIIEDIPANSHLTFNLMIAADVPMFGVFTYVVLPEGTNLNSLEEKIVGLDIPDNRFPISQINLQPIEEVHLSKALTFELKPPGDKGYLYLFSGIAVFILIISCTNYVNLSTAIYANRTKEVAIRKVLGSSKNSLVLQFLSESVLLTLLTLPLVVLIIEAILPVFRNFVNVPLKNELFSSVEHVLLLLAITIAMGLLAGLYPVLTLTHFSPLKLFKGGPVGRPRVSLRKVLLTLQFMLLLFLGTGAFFINKQLRFIQNKDLGIIKEGIVKVSNAYNIQTGEQYNTIKTQSLSSPNILGLTNGMPPGTETTGLPYKAEGHEERNDVLSFSTDLDYFEVMGVDGLYGDFFEKSPDELPSISMLVNEKFVELMGWDDPIGKKVTLNLGPNQRDRLISGVFKNYNMLSLHSEVVPLFIYVRTGIRRPSENIMIKINMQNIQASLEAIEQAWYDVLPGVPIEYEFMNEDIQAAYEQEQRAGDLSVILSTLAIILAVMGLIGLAAYMARLRIKEVGIRKVLGASLGQVLVLFNREFIVPLTLATLIGGSLCFYVVNQWLGTFAYRTSIDLVVYPLAGILIFLVTFLTVSIQSAKTAMQNPVKALRHE